MPADVREVHIGGWKIFQYLGATLGVLLLSVTYLAERAIPGDSLYSVKVSFNEEVRSSLALSPYEKVAWETERLNRRIAEARVLASEGRLTDDVESDVADAVREHSDNARREIEVLKKTDKEGATLASIQLATAIDVQSTSLRKDSNASTTEGKSTARIASALAESETAIEASDVANEVEVPSFNRLKAQVEQDTTRAYELLRNIDTHTTPAESTDIKRRLEDIERVVAESLTQAESDSIISRQQLLGALQRTQRLIVYMTNIDVRNSVTVEEIVPVTLTMQERLNNLLALARETVTTSEAVEADLAATTTSSALKTKLIPAVIAAREVATAALSDLEENNADILGFEATISAAHAVVADAATLLSINPNKALDLPLRDGVAASSSTSSATTTISTATSSTSATSTNESSGDSAANDVVPG